MPSTITRPKSIRIKNEAADYFDSRPLNKMINSLYEQMVSGEIEFDGEKLITKGSSKKDEKTPYESILEMASLMQVTPEILFEALNEALEEGTLYYSNGKLVNPRYEEFERACGDRNIDKILESMIRSL